MSSRQEILLTGTGGQGLILASIILAEAAVNDGKNVVQTQSYGPESRGGASMAGVIIDIDTIEYPLVTRPDVLLAMSKASYLKYLPSVLPGGLVIVDSTFIDGPYSEQHKVIDIPITRITKERLGQELVANIVALAVVNAAANLVKPAVLADSILHKAPKGSEQLNLQALELGDLLYKEWQKKSVKREQPGSGRELNSYFVVERGEPLYIALGLDGLQERAEKARKLASPCMLCGRRCRVVRFERVGGDERAGVTGVCKTGRKAVVSSHGPHFGEEPPITGYRGSGTIFFAHCNLKCMFCQNYQIAHLGEGDEVDDADLAAIMISLQKAGCHNINLVSPTHVVPQILSALVIAVKEGLNIPLVYNTGGYDLPETINLLSGIVDIYMPDMKFGSGEASKACLQAADYPEVNFRAVKEMHRQVGDLVTDRQGVAVRGLLVRHLVLPEDLAGTAEVMKFISEEISKDTYINIMDQYYPCHEALGHPVLGRRITRQEYHRALEIARSFGLTRLG